MSFKSILMVLPLTAALAGCAVNVDTRPLPNSEARPSAAGTTRQSIPAEPAATNSVSNIGTAEATPGSDSRTPNPRYPALTVPEGVRECPYLSLADVKKILAVGEFDRGKDGEIVGTGPSIARGTLEQLLSMGCSYNDANGQFITFRVGETLGDVKQIVLANGAQQMEPKIGIASTMTRCASPTDPVTITFGLQKFIVRVTAKSETDSADLALKAARLLSWHVKR